MSDSTLKQPIAEAVEMRSRQCEWMPKEFAKVRGVLKAYALRKGIRFSDLTVLDVCDDLRPDQINRQLEAFVGGLPKSRAYLCEIRSRLSRIVRHLARGNDALAGPDGPAIDIPDFLRPVLPLLAREGTLASAGKCCVPRIKTEERLNHPLTEPGRRLLLLLLTAVTEFDIKDLDSLCVEHRRDVQRLVRRVVPPRLWDNVKTTFSGLVTRLGYGSLRGRLKLRPEEWPPTLRRQFEKLREDAPRGIDDNARLVEQAARFRVTVVPLTQNTVARYESILAVGLLRIFSLLPSPPQDLDVRDLLRLEPREDECDGGRTSRLVNPLVELYRDHERQRASEAKRIGYDSMGFRLFTDAIKAVAAYNGHFSYHEAFRAAYRANLDLKLRASRKEAKKEAFNLDWIDSEIDRMYPAFREVVRRRQFVIAKHSAQGSHASTQKSMRFCLFFIFLVMLRYMGHRQQQIRNCEVGRNVVFGPDDSVHFNWKPGEVKNRKELDQSLNRDEHKTHRLLIDVLLTYYKRVYPYIMRNAALGPGGRDLLEKQLFVRITPGGKFRRFPANRTQPFHRCFCSWSREFMEFGGRAGGSNNLHPHYFRGLAADWMVDDLGVTVSKASDFFGDCEDTIKKHYRRRDPKLTAAPALDEANEKLRVKESKEGGQAVTSGTESAYKEELLVKDELLQTALGRIDDLQSQLIEALKNRNPGGGAAGGHATED